MITAFKTYNQNGFACLPTKADKSPMLRDSWKNGFGEEAFTNAVGIGVICGQISGGLECFDFDNHFGDAPAILKEYLSIPEVKAIYSAYKLPVETSKRGGYHLLFRCTKNEGNRKLAQRLNSSGKPEAFIETRGTNGYFCAYPSEGYTVLRNDIFNVAVITELERAVLIDNAVSLNEFYPAIIKTEYEAGDRPGDLYNQDQDSVSDMKAILLGAGWKQINAFTWRRPGKEDGISATLGKVARNVFYVFTSNAYPFEPMKAYTPFQVLGLLKFNGDFRAAASSVAPEKVSTVKPTITITEIEKILFASRIDTSKPIDRPPTILSIQEQQATSTVVKRLFTLGNFSCIVGKAKSKKTFLLSMLTAAILSVDKSGKFMSDMPTGKQEVLYFDTEQGDYDCNHVMRRIERMAGTNTHLRGFSLRQFSPSERCQIIEHAFKLWGSSIGFCVIDGIADLATAINDEEEASRVSTMLLRLTKIHNCHISTIIHQNKNDSYATGHLGSAIMKKAEILLSVNRCKDDKEASEVSCELSRGIDFETFELIINIDGIPEIRGATKKREYAPVFNAPEVNVREEYESQFIFPPKF